MKENNCEDTEQIRKKIYVEVHKSFLVIGKQSKRVLKI